MQDRCAVYEEKIGPDTTEWESYLIQYIKKIISETILNKPFLADITTNVTQKCKNNK